MPIEVAMSQPKSGIISSKPDANIAWIWNQNCVFVYRIFCISLWNSFFQDATRCHRLIENAHVHYVKLMAMQVKRMRQRVSDVKQNNLNNRSELHFQSVNTSANRRMFDACSARVTASVTEDTFIDFVWLRKKGERWQGETKVVEASHIIKVVYCRCD